MSLESMEPNPDWDARAHADTVAAWHALAGDVTVRVWGADWCPDCTGTLPDFAAALAAAEFPSEDVSVYPVDREKVGELTDAYGVTHIPTIVVERDGEELARFVESAADPPAVSLTARLDAAESRA